MPQQHSNRDQAKPQLQQQVLVCMVLQITPDGAHVPVRLIDLRPLQGLRRRFAKHEWPTVPCSAFQ